MTSRFADIDWILWSGTVGLERPIPERVEAAIAADFTSVSVSPPDIHRAEQGGTSVKEIGRMIRDQGLRIIVDPVMNWHPFSGTSASRFAEFSAEQSLRWVEALEAATLTAVAMDEADVPVEAMAGPFAELCDRAADVGAPSPSGVHAHLVRGHPARSVDDRAGRRSPQRRHRLRHLAFLPRRSRLRAVGDGPG